MFQLAGKLDGGIFSKTSPSGSKSPSAPFDDNGPGADMRPDSRNGGMRFTAGDMTSGKDSSAAGQKDRILDYGGRNASGGTLVTAAGRDQRGDSVTLQRGDRSPTCAAANAGKSCSVIDVRACSSKIGMAHGCGGSSACSLVDANSRNAPVTSDVGKPTPAKSGIWMSNEPRDVSGAHSPGRFRFRSTREDKKRASAATSDNSGETAATISSTANKFQVLPPRYRHSITCGITSANAGHTSSCSCGRQSPRPAQTSSLPPKSAPLCASATSFQAAAGFTSGRQMDQSSTSLTGSNGGQRPRHATGDLGTAEASGGLLLLAGPQTNTDVRSQDNALRASSHSRGSGLSPGCSPVAERQTGSLGTTPWCISANSSPRCNTLVTHHVQQQHSPIAPALDSDYTSMTPLKQQQVGATGTGSMVSDLDNAGSEALQLEYVTLDLPSTLSGNPTATCQDTPAGMISSQQTSPSNSSASSDSSAASQIGKGVGGARFFSSNGPPILVGGPGPGGVVSPAATANVSESLSDGVTYSQIDLKRSEGLKRAARR